MLKSSPASPPDYTFDDPAIERQAVLDLYRSEGVPEVVASDRIDRLIEAGADWKHACDQAVFELGVLLDPNLTLIMERAVDRDAFDEQATRRHFDDVRRAAETARADACIRSRQTTKVLTGARRGPRARGAGRPGRRAVRSSARSGDSGDDGPGEPLPSRPCACGCGRDISHKRADATTYSASCRSRLSRLTKPAEDKPSAPPVRRRLELTAPSQTMREEYWFDFLASVMRQADVAPAVARKLTPSFRQPARTAS